MVDDLNLLCNVESFYCSIVGHLMSLWHLKLKIVISKIDPYVVLYSVSKFLSRINKFFVLTETKLEFPTAFLSIK